MVLYDILWYTSFSLIRWFAPPILKWARCHQKCSKHGRRAFGGFRMPRTCAFSLVQRETEWRLSSFRFDTWLCVVKLKLEPKASRSTKSMPRDQGFVRIWCISTRWLHGVLLPGTEHRLHHRLLFCGSHYRTAVQAIPGFSLDMCWTFVESGSETNSQCKCHSRAPWHQIGTFSCWSAAEVSVAQWLPGSSEGFLKAPNEVLLVGKRRETSKNFQGHQSYLPKLMLHWPMASVFCTYPLAPWPRVTFGLNNLDRRCWTLFRWHVDFLSRHGSKVNQFLLTTWVNHSQVA